MESLQDLEKIIPYDQAKEAEAAVINPTLEAFLDFMDYLGHIQRLMVDAETAYGEKQGSEKLAKFKADWEELIKQFEDEGKKVPDWCKDFRFIQKIINTMLIFFKLATLVLAPKNAISFLAKTMAGSLIRRIS